ncbi:MAG: hypothetical protein OQJ95_06545 [Kangiella sp.]|nr:hypothetical protein [Kangiella sp.]MCW9029240.1 hypothetical protein [Kangiella sp.]
MNLLSPSPLFFEAADLVLSFEGGYSNDHDDKGGITKYGISQRSYPNVDIPNLTKSDALCLYFKDYWNPLQADRLPKVLAIAVFDGAVNHGVKQSAKILQQVLSVTADGIIGPVTLSAAFARNSRSILIDYLTARAELYHYLSIADSDQAKFYKGWMTRLFKLQSSLRTVL